MLGLEKVLFFLRQDTKSQIIKEKINWTFTNLKDLFFRRQCEKLKTIDKSQMGRKYVQIMYGTKDWY